MSTTILFRNILDLTWKYSVVSSSTTAEEIKKMVERDQKTHSFHGVFPDPVIAMEVSKKLEELNSPTHSLLNSETQHLYDGEDFESY